jgi:cytochrome o ubiquinol oxidase operon protein cyoD
MAKISRDDTDIGAAFGSFRSYIIGFGLSAALTLAAFYLAIRHVNSHHVIYGHSLLIAIVVALALAQLITQLVFFLHLGRESKPRWNLMVFGFMAIVVVILVGGSLWIMYNLNYHHSQTTNPGATDSYIIHDEGIKR